MIATLRKGFGSGAPNLSRYATLAVLAAMYGIAVLVSDAFLNPTYVFNLFRQVAPVGIAAIGVTYVMILGEVDLSIGAVVSASVVLCATMMDGDPANVPFALGLTGLFGLSIGTLNGLLVAYGRASSFILTLGTALAVVGLTQIYSGGTARGTVAPGFREFLNMRLWNMVPVLGLCLVGLVAVGIAYQRTSAFGRRLYLVGSNRAAARLSGLPVARTIIWAYALSGFFGALAGLAMIARSGASGTLVGQGLEFQVLAAVVLGGTTFEGGRGGIGGTIAGCFVLLIAFNLVIIAGLSSYPQFIVMGSIIIIASAIQSYFTRSSR